MSEEGLLNRSVPKKIRCHVYLSTVAAATLDKLGQTGFNFSGWVDNKIITELSSPVYLKERIQALQQELEKTREEYDKARASWVDPRIVHIKENLNWWEEGLAWLRKAEDEFGPDPITKREILYKRLRREFPEEFCSPSQWPSRIKLAEDYIRSLNDEV